MSSYYDQSPQEVERDPQWLYNVDALGDNPQWVIFVDADADADALVECNLDWAVSFDGDPSGGALRDNWELLSKPKRVVLAGSNGGAQRREELARRLGRHRCFTVTWPAGCQSASETLRKFGTEVVRDLVDNADQYPIDGLYRPSSEALEALSGRTPPETMDIGIMAFDEKIHLPTEGRLIVVTGYPAGGKTSMTRFILVRTAQKHNRRWAVFSPEMMPWEQFAADCAEVFIGKPFWPDKNNKDLVTMSRDDIRRAGAWLSERLTMIVCDSEDDAPTLDWILAKARDAVLRDGVTDCLLDPWNEVEHTRPERMSETDYIGRSLQRFKAFCARHGVNWWIIAHPTKPAGLKTGENAPMPGPYDIAASAHWANKPDMGLTVHAAVPDKNKEGQEQKNSKASVWIWKSRFRRFGAKNGIAEIEFDTSNGVYRQLIKSPGVKS